MSTLASAILSATGDVVNSSDAGDDRVRRLGILETQQQLLQGFLQLSLDEKAGQSSWKPDDQLSIYPQPRQFDQQLQHKLKLIGMTYKLSIKI